MQSYMQQHTLRGQGACIETFGYTWLFAFCFYLLPMVGASP